MTVTMLRQRHTAFTFGGRQRLRALILAPVLTVLLLLAQSVDLVHNHDGDLVRQFDCEVCLKLGANSDTVASVEYLFHIDLPDHHQAPAVTEARFIDLPPARSRAPPRS